MEEFIDILNRDGSFTGQSCTKSEIHSKGYYHNTVHVWLYTEKGEILLQQRSLQKMICPGLWDVSAAGHVDAGETILEAALREVDEELGLTVTEDELHFIDKYECFSSYTKSLIDNEFHNAFICKLPCSIEDLQILEDEVEAIKLVTIDTFLKLLDNSGGNNHFVPSNKGYYLDIINEVRKALS